jgi:hypothetical protein
MVFVRIIRIIILLSALDNSDALLLVFRSIGFIDHIKGSLLYVGADTAQVFADETE